VQTEITGEIFDVLRQVIKARGLTYKDLAALLNLSEPTIKRLFADKDCKLGRIIKICDVLDVELADIMATASRSTDETLILAPAVEQELAGFPSLFAFFLLLREKIPPEYIRSLYRLTQADIVLYGNRLEQLGLLEVRGDGTMRLTSDKPIKFRIKGPLLPEIKALNQAFIGEMFERTSSETDSLFTLSRRMRPSSARRIQRELQDLKERIVKFSRQDRLSSREEELATYKFVGTFGVVCFVDLFKIDPYPKAELKE
jgi:DNA-binding Xre family transcriptional regulator